MIRLRGVSKIYRVGNQQVPALRGIDLEIKDGEFLAIMGPSGSGKSTLMNIIGCLDRPTDGTYSLDNINIGRLGDAQLAKIRNRRLGFVFQSFNLLPRMSAVDQVALPLIYRGASNRKRAAMAALKIVGLSDRAHHKPTQLSGGQQQRVAVARALVGRPLILLADEPTGNLDSRNGEAVMSLLSDLHRNGATICMVTHDPRFASMADRTVHLFDGRVVEERVGVA